MAKTKRLTTKERLILIQLIHCVLEIWWEAKLAYAQRHRIHISPFGPWWLELVDDLDSKSDEELTGLFEAVQEDVNTELDRYLKDLEKDAVLMRLALGATVAVIAIIFLIAIWIT